MAIFEKLQEANENLEHVNTWLDFMTQKRRLNNYNMPSIHQSNSENKPVKKEEEIINEDYLSSEDWLKIHGLAAKKLELFDVLAENAFKHCDGVVDLSIAPTSGIGDAVIF